MQDEIRQMLHESAEIKKRLDVDGIKKATHMIIGSLRKGGKIMIAGNGGSATQASHFQGELIGRFKMERAALACISLTDLATITALSNDYSYDIIFEKKIEALGKKEDVFIGLSTSGNSENIIRAIKKAKHIGMKAISLIGKGGGKMKGLADVEIIVPSDNTPRIQESHGTILHIISELVEREMFKDG